MKFLTFFAFLLFTTHCNLLPQERHIHLNGEHLEPLGITEIDALFSQRVEDGNYWVNELGQWGYENNALPIGNINIAALQQIQAKEMIRNVGAPPNQGNQNGGQYRAPGNTEINTSQNGSVVTGNIGGKRCTYVSVGGMSMRSCD